MLTDRAEQASVEPDPLEPATFASTSTVSSTGPDANVKTSDRVVGEVPFAYGFHRTRRHQAVAQVARHGRLVLA
jgi:hypothetical protein